MSQATANGAPVLGGVITMSRLGAWRAALDVDLSDASKVTGQVELKVDDLAWSGTSVESGAYVGRTKLLVVGGKGGLRSPTVAKFYNSIPANVPVRDVLAEGGEQLSPTSDASLLATTLPFWTRPASTVGEGLEQLVAELGADWRILADGSVWVGAESWPAAKVDDVVVTAEMPAEAMIEFASKTVSLRPGMTFRGRRVEEVEIHIEPGAVRTKAWFEKSGGRGGGDVLRAALASLVRQETRHVDYYAIRGGVALKQNADGTLEIRLDDPSLPGMSKIPIAYGVPGVSAEVLAGARVHVEFENGSPAKPRAVVIDATKLKSLTIKATTKIVIDCPDVESQKGGRALARIGDMVRVISTPPGTPAIGQIVTGNKKHRG